MECEVEILRNLLIDELEATNAYERALQKVSTGKVQKVLMEIRKDEINHQGRLVNLILELTDSDLATFNAGLEQREV